MIDRHHTDWLSPDEIDAERDRLRRIAEQEENRERQLRRAQRVAEEEARHAAGNTEAGGINAGWRARLL